MNRTAPGSLGGFNALEEAPLLWAEWQAYAAAQARQSQIDARRQERGGKGGAHSRRIAGHHR